MTHHILPRKLALAAALTIALAAQAGAQVFLDFSTQSQFDNNFHYANNPANFVYSVDQNGTGNGFFKGLSNTGTYVYDADAGGAGKSTFNVSQGNPLTVSFKFSAQFSGPSIGVYIIDGSNANSAFLSILNIASGNDMLRFSNGLVDPAANGAGTLVNGSHSNNTDFTAAEGNTETSVIPFAGTYTLTYSINGSNQAVMELNVNGTTSTYTVPGSTAFTNVEVGFRSNGGGGAMRIDDLTITSVPEPGPAALLAALGAGLVIVRRRRLA